MADFSPETLEILKQYDTEPAADFSPETKRILQQYDPPTNSSGGYDSPPVTLGGIKQETLGPLSRITTAVKDTLAQPYGMADLPPGTDYPAARFLYNHVVQPGSVFLDFATSQFRPLSMRLEPDLPDLASQRASWIVQRPIWLKEI